MEDKTFEKITIPALENLKNGVKDRGLPDLKENWGPPWKYDEVVITGAGSSLEQAISKLQKRKKRSLIVANQSTALRLYAAGIKPDLVVLTDPQPSATRLVREFLAVCPARVVAGTTTTLALDPPKDTLFFKNLLQSDDRANSLWNVIVELMDPGVKTYILQVGSVVNASIIIMDYLRKANLLQFPEKPMMLFVGVDFEEPRCKRARVRSEGDIVLEDAAVDPQAFRFAGKLVTPTLLSYYNDCKLIVQQLLEEDDPWRFAEISFRIDSFFNDFLPLLGPDEVG